MAYAYLGDRSIVESCEDFDLHVDWLKNGWKKQAPYTQAVYECSNPHHASWVAKAQGWGDLEVGVELTLLPSLKEPLILSVSKIDPLHNLLINTAGFFEGEVRRLADLGLPDYHFEPFNVVARTKKDLKAEIKKYGEYLHEKYSGEYGNIYVKYY